jgi:hypothetical protein
MAKHTPGPWWVTDSGVRDSGGYICHTNSVTRYPGQDERHAFEVAQREADRRLIAAAPELLEAAQKALARWAEVASVLPQNDALEALEWGEEFTRLRAAITKATGAAP